MFSEMVDEFDDRDYPDEIPSVVEDASCRVFGHMCPVYFTAEPLTETKDRRKHSRSIPRDVMLKVVRRDGQICQECHEPVPDNQVEFDHIIPFSRGGISSPPLTISAFFAEAVTGRRRTHSITFCRRIRSCISSS
jgi:5-methylcytosine-specific restriction endonuclease McrA